MASNITYKFYPEKFAPADSTQYVGHQGELFWDPEEKKLRISDGVTPGGIVLFSAN